MALHGKQIQSGSVANDRLATASNTASANSVVVSKANAKIDLSYIPVDELNLSGSVAFAEDSFTTLATTADGDAVSAVGLSQTPSQSSVPLIYLNGVLIKGLKYGDKTGSAYFSNTNGSTAAARNALTSGTLLHWNASVAGFQLQPGWSVKLVYTV
jgi:hypothetical protein